MIILEVGLRYCRAHLTESASQKLNLTLGNAIFAKLNAVRLEALNKPSGSLVTVARGYEVIRDFLSHSSLSLIGDLPFLILFIIFMAVVAGSLAFITLTAVLVMLLVTGWLIHQLRQGSLQAHKDNSLKNHLLMESLNGKTTVRQLCAQPVLQQQWENLLLHSIGTQRRIGGYNTLPSLLSPVVQGGALMLVIIFGVQAVHANTLTPGALIAAVILNSRALASLPAMVQALLRYNEARQSYLSLQSLMNAPLETDATKRTLPLLFCEGAITFKNVSFQYKEQKEMLLQNISFHITGGERVGIIGANGSGKSTLFRLLLGFYVPNQGQILLDNTKLDFYDTTDRRRLFGVVSQETHFFAGTIRENITLAAPGINEEQFRHVCQLSGIEKWIGRLEEGYNTPLAEQGQSLSGGQKQTLALARALLLKPRILLLDEPLNSLDQESSRHFLKVIEQLPREITILIISHHLPTLALTQRLLRIEQGQIKSDIKTSVFLKGLQQHAKQEGTDVTTR
jgi:ATP-binding cassette subfamily C protein LapB